MTNAQRIGTDDLERQVIHNISDFGWHAVNVIEDDGHPPWTYSIGFHETWNHPEIIIGRSRSTAHHILETIATDLDENHPPNFTAPTLDLIPGNTCHYLEVLSRYYPDYVGFSRWYYRKRHFPLHQIVWPNNDGLYPWDERADHAFKQWQPFLSEQGKPID